MNIEMEEKKKDCLNFAIFGSSLGIILPLAFFVIYVSFFDGDIIKLQWFPFLCGLLVISAIIPFVAYILYDKYSEYEIFTDIALRTVGVITVLLVGVIIYYTGGYSNSIFTFYLFFIPAAVAISFRANKSLYLIVPISFIVSLINYLITYESDFDFGCMSYKFLFLSTLACHFASILILELKKK